MPWLRMRPSRKSLFDHPCTLRHRASPFPVPHLAPDNAVVDEGGPDAGLDRRHAGLQERLVDALGPRPRVAALRDGAGRLRDGGPDARRVVVLRPLGLRRQHGGAVRGVGLRGADLEAVVPEQPVLDLPPDGGLVEALVQLFVVAGNEVTAPLKKWLNLLIGHRVRQLQQPRGVLAGRLDPLGPEPEGAAEVELAQAYLCLVVHEDMRPLDVLPVDEVDELRVLRHTEG
mmetsp:Transcript_9496/g.26648  ORF Transcript_9496/g.26648 Transcript_9496/m.26648 type:complete len:229 (+) Transcript_9496:14-700(+)